MDITMTPEKAPAQMRDDRIASAIIVQFGREDILIDLVESLADHSDAALVDDMVIVDNGGSLTEATRCSLNSVECSFEVVIVRNEDTSYSSGVNAGVACARSGTLIIMNNDLRWTDDTSIRPLINVVRTPPTGVAGAQLLNMNGSWQRSHGRFPSIPAALESVVFIDTARNLFAARRARGNRPLPAREVDYVDGALMCVSRECFAALGGFDTSKRFYGEDTDFCYRARAAGWRVQLVPDARVIHLRGATSSRESLEVYERKLFKAKVDFVEQRKGRLRSRIYAILLGAALASRAFVYSLVALARPTQDATARAASARARWSAVTHPED